MPGVDNIMASHQQEIYPNTSLKENCLEFEFQTDQNYYVGLRQLYLALKLKFVKSCVHENYNTKQVGNDQKKEEKQMRKRRRTKRF